MAHEKEKLSGSTTLVFSDEALRAEQMVVDLLSTKTSRIARYEMAIIILAQVLGAHNSGSKKIDITTLSFKELP